MKNMQVLPLANMNLSDFKNKVSSVAKSLKWKEKDELKENSVFFTTSPNLDSSLGNIVEVRYLNPNIGIIIISSRNKLQIAEGGDTTKKILDFVERFYKENSP